MYFLSLTLHIHPVDFQIIIHVLIIKSVFDGQEGTSAICRPNKYKDKSKYKT